MGLDYDRYVSDLEKIAAIDESLAQQVQEAAAARDIRLRELRSVRQHGDKKMEQAERRAEEVLAEAIASLDHIHMAGILPRKQQATPHEKIAHRTAEACEEAMWSELNELNSLARQLYETKSSAHLDGTEKPHAVEAELHTVEAEKKRTARRNRAVAAILGLAIVVAVMLVIL